MGYDWERQSCEDQRNERAADVRDCTECGKSIVPKGGGSADYNCMCEVPGHKCEPDSPGEDDNHAQCWICDAWMFLNCSGRWQRTL